LSKVKHPNIYLKEVGFLADSSSVGSFVPAISAMDLNDNKPVSINGLIKDKYVFIDFWGSWCGPCIQSIPKLRSFYERIKDRTDVLMLGVAKENNKKDIEKLKKIIGNEKIGWLNLWLADKEKEGVTSIINKLAVEAYPTYLIIDNKGKIVYKEQSIYKTEEAINLFMKLINE
jgi:thiol-disulfide isomerase/thioredoxin